MTLSLSKFIIFTLLALSLHQNSIADEVDNSSVWQQLKHNYFGQRFIHHNATDLLFIEVPDKVEDAAIMPITIKSLAAQTAEYHIKTLHLIVDNNPQPYSAAFHLSPELGPITLSTRIRMDSFSNVRIIAEMNDNSLHMVSRFVIASGGCSSPVSKDRGAALSRLGKVQIRARPSIIGQQKVAQIIISHPNASGMQFDDASRQFIPAHYVTNIKISFDNETLISAETGITMSENPSVRFVFTPKTPGTLKATITDSKQHVYINERYID